MTTSKGGPRKGKPKTAAHKAKIAEAQTGKTNSNYKHGARIDYRKKVGAKSDEIVHHLDNDHTNHALSNLQRLKGRKPGAKTNSLHERITDRGAGRPKGS